MSIFFTSDLHFGHKNICGENALEEGRKQFKDVDEMKEHLIEAHNNVVNVNDIVINHGDFSFNNNVDYIVDIINRMNGALIIVLGNHDSVKTWAKVEKVFEGQVIKVEEDHFIAKLVVHEMGFKVKANKKATIYHSHFPMQIGEHETLFNMCGHIHSQDTKEINQINVGIDSELAKRSVLMFGEPISSDAVSKEMYIISKELLWEKNNEI